MQLLQAKRYILIGIPNSFPSQLLDRSWCNYLVIAQTIHEISIKENLQNIFLCHFFRLRIIILSRIPLKRSFLYYAHIFFMYESWQVNFSKCAWSLKIESNSLCRDLASENDGQLPDSRLERENCFLTLPVCDKMWRVAPSGDYLRFYSFGWLSPGPNSIIDVVRRFVLFKRRQRTPPGSIGKSPCSSTCLDPPSLST